MNVKPIIETAKPIVKKMVVAGGIAAAEVGIEILKKVLKDKKSA